MIDIESYLIAREWSDNTLARYKHALSWFAGDVDDPRNLTAGEFRAWLDLHWRGSARWVAFCAVRGYLAWAYGAAHPALALRIRRGESPPQRVLSMIQVRSLLASFDESVRGRRDLAMCGLMLDTGLRCSEVCRLAIKYLDLDNRSLQVLVKGGHWRGAIYSEHTAGWLADWLAGRQAVDGVGTVFVSVGGLTAGRPITRSGLNQIVRVWGKVSGIGALSPHDLRRSMASLATKAGSPDTCTMRAGGWHSASAFARYTVGVVVDDFKNYLPVKAAMGE